jgi:hypothetical protein
MRLKSLIRLDIQFANLPEEGNPLHPDELCPNSRNGNGIKAYGQPFVGPDVASVK